MKKILIILVFVFILLVSSCSSKNNAFDDEEADAADGVSFDYFTSYVINDTKYEIFLPNNVKESIYYQYEIGDVQSDSAMWTVNFIYDVNYHVDVKSESKDVWDSLYSYLLESKMILDEKCEFDIMLFEPYTDIELEYLLVNEQKEEASYVIFYTFLPIRLVNNSSHRTITVGIPINVDVLLKVGEEVENPFKDEMMLWEDFLAI